MKASRLASFIEIMLRRVSS